VIFALAATLAIVVQDHTMLRAAPRSSATVLTALSQGDALEVRGMRAGYLKVYDYRRERGGYLRNDTVRQLELTEAGAPDMLAVLRFLRESPGFEALGISYGAAYLKAAPARALNAEPLDAIARMAERLGEQASSTTAHAADVAAHLEVIQQFGVHMRTFERNGRMQVCYDGELFHRVLAQGDASAEQRASAALGLTRPDCIDPDLTAAARATLDDERRELLDAIDDKGLGDMMRSRIHARRAAVWASLAFERARRGLPAGDAGARALAELLAVKANDLGDDRRDEYLDAVLRVGAIRWAREPPAEQHGPYILGAEPGDPGQTCVSVHDARQRGGAALLRRCTYGIVWLASLRAVAPAAPQTPAASKTLASSQTPALVLAVQPLDGWRELWVFQQRSGVWKVDVLSPGTEEPELGYIEFAGYAADSRRLLIAREVKEHGRFQRRFEELRLQDLALERQASTPDALRDFGRWQDGTWRTDTLALH
jgi:hypothetical protein